MDRHIRHCSRQFVFDACQNTCQWQTYLGVSCVMVG